MDLYTIDQAHQLITFYADKMVGKTLEQSTQSIVGYLDKELHGDNKYRVIAVGKMMRGNIIPKRSIDRVAKDLNLPTPEDVLNNPSQH